MDSQLLDELIQCRDNGAWAALCALAEADAQCYTDKLVADGIQVAQSSVLQGKIQALRAFFGLDNPKSSALHRLIEDGIAQEKRNNS